MHEISVPAIQELTRLPYAFRRVPRHEICHVVPIAEPPKVGDLALAKVASIGRTARIELDTGRMSTLYPEELLGVVFGHRYATGQYEAYARLNGDRCDLLTVAGVCGKVESKQQSTADPTRLTILGYLSNADGRGLNLKDFALQTTAQVSRHLPTVVVCGASMNSGKTHAASAIVRGLVSTGHRVGAGKLTGTAAGRDVWSMLDAGACQVYDFSDAGFPSTFGCTLDELLKAHQILASNLAAAGAEVVVFEIADGVLQQETMALLTSPEFTRSVDLFVYAAGDPLSAVGGVTTLREMGIEAAAVSGKVSMSPLAIREVEQATSVRCLTAKELLGGALNREIMLPEHHPALPTRNGAGKRDQTI